MCIDPGIPHNEGCLQHIEVKAPKGTIVNAEWPGPTAAATIVPADSITDAVWKCLAQAVPEKVVAGCGHVTPNCVTTGIDRRVKGVEKPFGVILFNGSSGGGASATSDGWPFLVTPGTVGGLRFAPIEIIELHFPLVVKEYQVRTDSMGAGKHCGGPGLNFFVTPRGTGQIDNYGYGDGMSNPPFGLFGGKPGGNQRTAAFRGFDNESSRRQAADNAISKREVCSHWRHGHREFRNKCAARFKNFISEMSIFLRVYMMQPISHDSNCTAARF